MFDARLAVDPDRTIGTIDRRLFGWFVRGPGHTKAATRGERYGGLDVA